MKRLICAILTLSSAALAASAPSNGTGNAPRMASRT